MLIKNEFWTRHLEKKDDKDRVSFEKIPKSLKRRKRLYFPSFAWFAFKVFLLHFLLKQIRVQFPTDFFTHLLLAFISFFQCHNWSTSLLAMKDCGVGLNHVDSCNILWYLKATAAENWFTICYIGTQLCFLNSNYPRKTLV